MIRLFLLSLIAVSAFAQTEVVVARDCSVRGAKMSCVVARINPKSGPDPGPLNGNTELSIRLQEPGQTMTVYSSTATEQKLAEVRTSVQTAAQSLRREVLDAVDKSIKDITITTTEEIRKQLEALYAERIRKLEDTVRLLEEKIRTRN